MNKLFSPNMLKTFETCPQKYWFKYIQKISMPQKSSFFEKGKKVHALANYYLQGCDISKLETALNANERAVWENLKQNEFFQKTYVASEYNLSCKVGEYWVGGRIDALVRDTHPLTPSPQGRGNIPVYYILDYKTGSIPKNPEYDFQTMVYLLCASKKFTHTPTPSPLKGKGKSQQIPTEITTCVAPLKGEGNAPNIKFVYIDLKNNQNCVIDFDKNYEPLIIEICDKIKNAQPLEEIERSKKCEFCEYKKLCI